MNELHMLKRHITSASLSMHRSHISTQDTQSCMTGVNIISQKVTSLVIIQINHYTSNCLYENQFSPRGPIKFKVSGTPEALSSIQQS